MSELRKGKLLEKLLSMETITTSELAILFQVSSRTIRNDIKEINQDLASYDAWITLTPNKGALLNVKNQAQVRSLIQAYEQATVYTKEQRVSYIITLLMLSKKFVSIAQLAQTLYLSESQLFQELKKVNKELLAYHLEVTSKGKKGLVLTGREKNKRRYLVDQIQQLLKTQKHYLLSDVVRKQLRKGLEKILQEESYDINDDMFDYLILHILITMYRHELGFSMELDFGKETGFQEENEYLIAKEIASFLEKHFQCVLPISEISYITLQLLGKKRYPFDTKSDEEIKAMIETILQVIQQKFTIDFREDEDLKKSLYLHMMPLMNRMRYDLELRNPLIQEIKMNYPLTYDLAGEVALLFNQHYGFKLKEDEIAYLSVHFNLALERYKKKITKQNVLFVLSQGTSTSELLEYKFLNQFQQYLQTVTFCSIKKVDQASIKHHDLIISTHDISYLTKDYLRITPFMNEEDQKNIQAYFLQSQHDLYLIDCISSQLFFTDIHAVSKAEAITNITQRLEALFPDLDHLYDSIMERENLLTTELGNHVAFPHPLNPLGSTTFMSVTILDHPILWDNQSVQVIFLSTIAKENDKRLDYFYASFVEIVKDDRKIAQLLTKKEFSTLVKLIQ